MEILSKQIAAFYIFHIVVDIILRNEEIVPSATTNFISVVNIWHIFQLLDFVRIKKLYIFVYFIFSFKYHSFNAWEWAVMIETCSIYQRE